MKFRIIIYIVVYFIFFQNNAQCNRPAITIWVHGTRLITEFFAPRFFHREPGLNPVSNLEKIYQLRKLAELLCAKDPEQYYLHNFYIFGWSGKLSIKERRKAAQQLYDEMLKLIIKYEKSYNEKPYIRIITHSHGGNVALHVAEFADPHFIIDELILLACPVQKLTSHFITYPCFKKVYTFYSTRDMLQVIDPQGLYTLFTNFSYNSFPLFSERIFQDCSKLKQTQITYNKRSLWHIEFLFTKFVGLLPSTIKHMENSQEHQFTIDITS